MLPSSTQISSKFTGDCAAMLWSVCDSNRGRVPGPAHRRLQQSLVRLRRLLPAQGDNVYSVPTLQCPWDCERLQCPWDGVNVGHRKSAIGNRQSARMASRGSFARAGGAALRRARMAYNGTRRQPVSGIPGVPVSIGYASDYRLGRFFLSLRARPCAGWRPSTAATRASSAVASSMMAIPYSTLFTPFPVKSGARPAHGACAAGSAIHYRACCTGM